MAENLKSLIQAWRGATTGQDAQNKLLAKLQIGNTLYSIKDPAVEELAAQVETRLGAIESKTIRESALSKDEGSGKFATSVTHQFTKSYLHDKYAEYGDENLYFIHEGWKNTYIEGR